MKYETIEDIYAGNAKVRGRLKALIGSIPLEKTSVLPDGEKWTIAQILEHVAMVDESTVKICAKLLKKAQGVTVLDERKPGGYPTAATEAANRDTVYVGRIREDISSDRGLNLWVVSDNVRKGAATNSVQIAEIMVRDYI